MDTGVYLYHEDDALLNTETTDAGYQEIVRRIQAAAVILITLLMLRREGRDMMAVERAISRLGGLNLSADQELEPFYGRSDEIGMIAQTTHRVCGCLRKTIDDVGRILGEIASGNLNVDAAANESYYVGDFKALSASLQSIHTNLVNIIRVPPSHLERHKNNGYNGKERRDKDGKQKRERAAAIR